MISVLYLETETQQKPWLKRIFFKVDESEDLDKDKAEEFHTFVAKG